MIDQEKYREYLQENKTTADVLSKQLKVVFPCDAPHFCILLTATNELRLKRSIDAIKAQTYSRYVCIIVADDVDESIKKDERMKVFPTERGMKPLVSASHMAEGDFVFALDEGDALSEDALYHLAVASIATPDADIIIAGEDERAANGERTNPKFKKGYAPDTLRCYDYLGRMVAVRQRLFRASGGINDVNGDALYDYHLRLIEKAQKVLCVEKILLTCNSHALPPSEQGGKAALDAALRREGKKGYVTSGFYPGSFIVRYGLVKSPRISIIIGDIRGKQQLSDLITSIAGRSTYDRYEMLLIDDGMASAAATRFMQTLQEKSVVRIVKYREEYNRAASMNAAARLAHGSLLLFLGAFVEAVSPDFLETMGAYAQQAHIGAVGGLLTTVDKRIYGAGLTVTAKDAHAHIRQGARDDKRDKALWHDVYSTCNVMAVSSMCMMVERKRFLRAGGFDATLPEIGYDVALCIAMKNLGAFNVFTPLARFNVITDPTYNDKTVTKLNTLRMGDVYRPIAQKIT